MRPYPTPTMAELSLLGWAGFILIPLVCEAFVLILIFRFPWRWSILAITIASVVNWFVGFVGFGGLGFFADKFAGLLYLMYGIPLKVIIVSVFLLYQIVKSGSAGPIALGLFRCIAGSIISIVLGWALMVTFLGFLDSHNLIWG